MPTITEKRVDLARAIELLRNAVEAKGEEYIYPPVPIGNPYAALRGCAYFNEDGTPSCILGHCLAELGITLEDPTINNYSYNVENTIDSVPLADIGLELSRDALTAWSQAQAYQDAGRSWGVAVSRAISAGLAVG